MKIKMREQFIIFNSVYFYFFAIKSDKTNSEISFLIFWLTHNDISFILQFYDKKLLPFNVFEIY